MSNWERREINNLIPEKPEDYKKRFPKPFSSMIPADAGPDNKLATEEYVNSHSGGGGSTADAVKYTSQSLTDDQKAQARANIGAGTYDKPQTGIPASDLETGVIPDVSGKADKSDTPRVVSFQQDLDELPGEIIEELRLGDIVSCLGEPYEVIVRDSARIQLSVGGLFYEFVKTNDVWSYNTQGPYLESARLNKVTSLSAQSTDTQYPSAKATYDAINPSVQSSQPQGGMLPNVVYDFGELAGNTTFLLATPADANIVNHYYWMFDTGATAPTVTFPASITAWNGGSAPTISENKHYEISVLNGIGAFIEV